MSGKTDQFHNAIFEFKSEKDPSTILLWPKPPSNAGKIRAEDLIGERSNLQIFLDSGITVLLDLKISDKQVSVTHIILDFPERDKESKYVKNQIAEKVRQQKQDYERRVHKLEEKVEEQATRRMGRNLLERLHCEYLSETNMTDLLIVQANRICRVGKEIFIDFMIQNRSRDLFTLGDVEISTGGSKDGEGVVDTLFEYDGNNSGMVGFNGRIRGIAIFSVNESNVAAEYVIRVTEDGGRKRVVTVEDVGF